MAFEFFHEVIVGIFMKDLISMDQSCSRYNTVNSPPDGFSFFSGVTVYGNRLLIDFKIVVLDN
jgi:hypothetical protein